MVHGKGGVVRTVQLAPGVRRALRAWIAVRGDEAGPLITPITCKLQIQADVAKRMATNTVAQAVTRRFGDDVKPHDLRRTFTGNLLESGADLSVVSKVLGHVSPATTAGYDRRGQVARLAAVEKLHVPLEDFDARA